MATVKQSAAPTSSTYGLGLSPQGALIGGRGNSQQSRPPLPVYSPGGNLCCYMAQDDDEPTTSDVTQHDQVSDIASLTTSSEDATAPYSFQEYEMQSQPTHVPHYIDEYGHVHYLG